MKIQTVNVLGKGTLKAKFHPLLWWVRSAVEVLECCLCTLEMKFGAEHDGRQFWI